MGEGAAAIVGPFESGPATEVATIKGSTLTPVFLLADGVRGSTSIYSVPLQSGTSAAAGARAVAKDGARTFVLITREGNGANRQRAAHERGGMPGLLRYLADVTRGLTRGLTPEGSDPKPR
jgi:hypothetical protein